MTDRKLMMSDITDKNGKARLDMGALLGPLLAENPSARDSIRKMAVAGRKKQLKTMNDQKKYLDEKEAEHKLLFEKEYNE